MRLKTFYDDIIERSLSIDEGLDRSVIIRKSDYKTKLMGIGTIKAEYEWTLGNRTYYLFVHETADNGVEFKFLNNDNRINKTGDLQGKPATSVFSGAILAIKEFLENYKGQVEYFTIDAMNSELNRVSLYRAGTKYIAKETGFKFRGEHKEVDSVKFIFQKV